MSEIKWNQWDNFEDWAELVKRMNVYRLEPSIIRGQKIKGFLFSVPPGQSIEEINEKIGNNYGGGIYRIKVMSDDDKILSNKMLWISGLPLYRCDCPILKIVNRGCRNPYHR